MYHWNMRISGGESTMSVESILEQVELKRKCRGLSPKDVFSGIYELLVGGARKWYLANHKQKKNLV